MKISDNVWKYSADSNLYYLELEKKIVIDAGHPNHSLSLDFDTKKVEYVILTHMHYDHVGHLDLFPNAKIMASRHEIEDFRNDPFGTVLNREVADKLKNFKILPVERISGLKIINTPGHTRGCISIWLKDYKILFSGDTLFDGCYGRLDLPTSAPSKMQESLKKLRALDYEVLCPGHDY